HAEWPVEGSDRALAGCLLAQSGSARPWRQPGARPARNRRSGSGGIDGVAATTFSSRPGSRETASYEDAVSPTMKDGRRTANHPSEPFLTTRHLEVSAIKYAAYVSHKRKLIWQSYVC